jgi:hypothetical protein
MQLTPYHTRYFAHDLTRRAAGGLDRLSTALFDAAVDLNPHQIEAALFALESPLSKGVVLADEVGLGKTIEAGIVQRIDPPLVDCRERRMVSRWRARRGDGAFGWMSAARRVPRRRRVR